jgi:uncharacterized protein
MFIKRNLKNKVAGGLKYSPVVLINGARQSGKSTLAKNLIEDGLLNNYITLDDPTTLGALTSSPVSFLQSLPFGTVIDEVQRVPEVFTSIKYVVDKDRQNGRFLLTGSANVLLLPKLSDSLAGRMEIHTLRPLSQGELLGAEEKFVDWLFSDNFSWPKINNCSDLTRRIAEGGYPQPISQEYTENRINKWYEDYLNTLLVRDVRDISNIEQIGLMPLLLKLLATRTANILNYSDVSRSLNLPWTSLKRYMQLLETLFLVEILPAWYGNQSKRITKAPKIHLSDTGFVLYLLGYGQSQLEKDRLLFGDLLENFVLLEIQKQLSWNQTRARLYYSRSQNDQEVDIVVEAADGRLVAVEVKSSSSVDTKDMRNMKAFKEMAGDKFHRGIILYTGQEVHKLESDIYFMPVQSLWEVNKKFNI